ncbi:MAG: HAMP domain-containing protein [Erysipelotrichia bacterium]|nr:HAMP domain-containing protein [Erysipelotrichia bacterium]
MRAHIKGKLQSKLIGAMILVMMAITIAMGYLIAVNYRDRMEDYYAKIAQDQAKIAASYIDGDRIAKYLETLQKDDYYSTVEKQLLTIKKTVGLKYLYVVIPYEDHMVYIWDVGEQGEAGICHLGDSDVYYGKGKDFMVNAFRNPGSNESILITSSEEYGYIASAYNAVVDSSGKSVALASVDISMDEINSDIRAFVVKLVEIMVLISVIAAGVYIAYIKRKIAKPITALAKATGNIKNSMNDLQSCKVNIHTGDEIETLAQSFNYMTEELESYIAHLSQVTAEKEHIRAELNVATQIQASMLPCIFPPFPERSEFDIYAVMYPAKEVGGDFFDFFMVDKRHIAVVAADVSGKGVPAALFMVIGKTLIKDHSQNTLDLGTVFSEVNDLLCQSNSEGMFITAFEGVLDLITGEFRFVNAGHELPYISRHGAPYEAQKIQPGFVLAGMPHIKYKAGRFTMEPGDKLFQYTDGVTEATDSQNQLYGMNRLAKVLNNNISASPELLLLAVKEDIDVFVGEAPQFDDITMLCLEYKQAMTCKDNRDDSI